MIKIITHRGLDPARSGYFAESSLEAFVDQLRRGYGLEFDIQFASNEVMIAVHDATLKRITGGKDERKVRDVASEEILGMEFNGCRLTSVPHVFSMIAQSQADGALSALHLKHLWQEPQYLDEIIDAIIAAGVREKQMIIFDAKPEAARYLKERLPGFEIAASVSHPYDVKRYNAAVGGTLLTLEEFIGLGDLYSWAWLDEWDLADEGGGRKKLLTQSVFDLLRRNGKKIALVTPELHAKSPGLVGGEAHEDGVEHARLVNRMKEILALAPDAVCTDYPDEVRDMVNG